jgi:endoglucanase
MAQASRIFKNFSQEFPGLADSCMTSAVNAWQWAKANPEKLYNQQALNQQFDPDIQTGAYGDRSADDEFSWAAAELLISTNDEKYFQAVKFLPDEKMPLPSWNQVRLLGYYSLLRHEKNLPANVLKDVAWIKQNLIKTSTRWVEDSKQNPYQMVMGLTEKDFIWGSSSVAANQGILLLQAYNLTSDKKFLHAALDNLDYLLGRNATGYSFVTGFGDKTPMYPHHRPSEGDGIDEPVPGLLSGGPNPGRQDNCNYPSTIPNEAFVDDVCSYASNEIAINWNAPLVYLVWAIEALQNP